MEQRYQCIREIGRGAMGVVYLGHDNLIDRKLALKELTISDDIRQYERDELVERFFREARAAGGLSHPNIVTVHDVFEEDGRYFIAMEFINGSKLSDMLRSGPFSIELARQVMIQCLHAVSYAHANGVIHRDLKPDNIFLTPDKRVKVTDFGIASIMGARRITTEGMVIGTPGYMSPEQVRGYVVDWTTDIFSLGIVLYELLTARNPFEADSSTAIMDRIVHDDPAPVREFNDSVPASVERTIEKALEKLPSNRFQTAEEFRECIAKEKPPDVEMDGSVTTVEVVKPPKPDLEATGSTVCHNCGQVVRREWVRCPWCTIDLNMGVASLPTPSGTEGTPTLTVVEGALAGSMFPMSKNVLYIGRGLDNDIQLEDALVSRHHARVYRATDGNFYLEDVGSSNGTYLNNEEITAARIRSGDNISMGETTMVFVSD